MHPLFGPAGLNDDARQKKLGTLQYLEYLADRGLTAFEYQCGHGIRIKGDTARAIGLRAAQLGISLSLHAPYFISLASLEEDKREKSVTNYIWGSAQTVDLMGGTRIVVHPGGLNRQSRQTALAVAGETLAAAQQTLDEHGLSHIHICPETMGKISQLGDLDEVIDLCRNQPRFIPCIDFGHMNARTRGGVNCADSYAALLDRLCDGLGRERVQGMHVHFSKIAYSAGGEVRHLTFEDSLYGPDPNPLMALFAQRGLSPTVICESAGTQCEDAAAMRSAFIAAGL